MTTETLIIELDARTSALQSELTATDRRLRQLEGQTERNDRALLSLSKAGKLAGAAISATAAAATASSAALAAAAVSASDYARELRIASDISRESTGRMQELAFATNTVGVDMDKLADISKDSFEKIGDYLNTGGGGFQDFADAMKLTKEEATELANEFKYLSGTEILQEMVKRMEDAGVSASQMSHALEGMASDTTNLIPLFSDSSKELNALTEEFNQLNIKLSDIELDKLDEVGKSIKTLSATVSGTTNKTVAALEEEITGVAELLTAQVGSIGTLVIQAVTGYQYMVAAATSSIMNLFREAEIASVEASIAIQETFGADFTSALATADTAVNDFFRNISGGLIDVDDVEFLQNATGNIEALKTELQTLKDDDVAAELFDADYFADLMDKNIAKVNEFKAAIAPSKDDGEGGDGGEDGEEGGEKSSELQALEDKYKTEEKLLLQNKKKELQIAADNNELKKEIEAKYIEELALLKQEKEAEADQIAHELWLERLAARNQEKFDLEIQAQQDLLSQKLITEEQYLKNISKIGLKYGKNDQKFVDDMNKEKEDSDADYADAAMETATALFGNNKAVKAANVVVDTAAGISKAFADMPYPAAIAASAQIAVTGIAQLAAIRSASESGGSSISSAPSASASSQPSEQPSVTGEVEINESIGSGGQTSSTSNTVTITAEDGDELAEAFASVMNKKLNSGEITLG